MMRNKASQRRIEQAVALSNIKAPNHNPVKAERQASIPLSAMCKG